MGRQRLWSHAYFESRLEAECGRAEASSGTFALARLQLGQPVAWTTLAPLFARDVPPPHIFGAYGPNDYELLLIEKSTEEVEALLQTAPEVRAHRLRRPTRPCLAAKRASLA